jgi:hypothetical protein
MDRADEVQPGVELRRQLHRNLAFAEFAFGYGRFFDHVAMMAAKIARRPEEATG